MHITPKLNSNHSILGIQGYAGFDGGHMGAHEERSGEEVISKRVRGVSVEATKMNYLRAENNCTKARMIPAHSDRLIEMAVSIPFMGFKSSGSSWLRAITFSVSVPMVITFAVPVCIMIHPFSVIVIL